MLRSIHTAPADEDIRTPGLPLGRQICIGTGIQYDRNKDVTVRVAYEYLDAGEAEVGQDGGLLQGPLKGEYDTNAIHFFAVNLIWKFSSTIGLIADSYNYTGWWISAISPSPGVALSSDRFY